MRRLLRSLALTALVGAAIVIAGCGSSSSSSSSSSGSSGTGASSSAGAKNGGAVTILETAGGVDSLDPGYWYYQTDYTDLYQTTQRALYGFRPQDTSPQPDLATAQPTQADGGKTLTFHIRAGVHYSAPLASRTVAAADIKYGMERCFAASVGNGYAFTYFGDIVGAPSKPSTGVSNISGIQAPNPTTLVIKTKVPVGVLAVPNALALPCTVPVPQDYAAKYDKGTQSTYGMHQVFTGPYMIKGAGAGTIPSSGYQTAKLLALVRNPSWQRATDPIRPAHFDSITFKGGNDVTVASRQTLSGQSMMSGDFAAPPTAILQQGLSTKKSQFQIAPSGGNRYIALNSTVKPLNNLNFRRAIAAVIDRNALRLTRGGAAVGTVATHFIPPQMPGFAQAGGVAGDPANDFYANPNGNVTLAESYMKKAGYPSGKYTGPPLLTIADNQPPASNTAQAVQSQLAQIGINLTFREVPHATMLTKYCEVPKAMVAICPTVGWGKDFFDSQSMITPVFYGPNIVPSGNTNMSQANDPALNKQMQAAAQIIDPTARADAWAKLDKEITSQVYVITWLWDNEVQFASSNVHGVIWPFNGEDWDLTASSLK
ncbi:MAG: ABC transporter substrate-binding protein [Solirubrobacteraceae bacterium]